MHKTNSRVTKADYEALLRFRYTLRRFLHFSEEAARVEGLTPQQHQLLLAVKGQPGREWASISDLAEALQVRHHTAVSLVDRCERQELVQRNTGVEDRRQVRVTLLPKGEEFLARLSKRHLIELHTLQQNLQLPGLEAIEEH